MPLDTVIPKLDNRTFEDIKRQALLRIPRYTPEWTDFNESDPGVTIIELFAWLTEMMLVQMNQVPARNYLKFLQLLGMELRPAQPARAYLTFTPQPKAPLQTGKAAISVPERTQVGTQPPDGGNTLIFETTEGLDLIRLELSDVQVFDGVGFTKVTAANVASGTEFRPFGFTPQAGSALYLGFKPPESPLAGALFPQKMRFRVFLPLHLLEGQPINCTNVHEAPEPPVKLIWEYRPEGTDGVWRRLNVFADTSAAFTREGDIDVQGPVDIKTSTEGIIDEEPRYWLRVRIDSGAYPAGTEPLVDFIRPNVAQAKNLSTVVEEFVGVSEGTPDQTFTLQKQPIQSSSLQLTIQDENQQAQDWSQRADLLASGPEDKHYTLNANSGQISFGDGKTGQIPVAGAEIVAKQYLFGGGVIGNVAAEQINSLLSSPAGVASVINERPAAGGGDEEAVEDFLKFVPAKLRHRDRAISAEDFSVLAKEVGGISRAKALPLVHPDHPGVEVPGAITVVVIPDNKDIPPKPSPGELEAVCRYLDERRLLTTEVHVKGPTYKAIRVEATIAAEPSAAFDEVRHCIIAKLNLHLNPQNWPFGQDLYPSSLYGVIQDVPDVRNVRFLQVRVNNQLHDKVSQAICLPLDGMVYGEPEHDITIVPYQEDDRCL